MKNGLLTISTFISVVLFPWPLSVLLALTASLSEPLVPLAAGIFADTLYYAPQAQILPVFTLYGAVASIGAVFVRRWLRASPVRDLWHIGS